MKKSIIAICALMASITAMNAQNYKVGDVYDTNGLKGIVIDVDASGQHGLIMSLDDSAADWAFVDRRRKSGVHYITLYNHCAAYGDSFGQENKKSGVALRYHSRGGILFFVHKRGFYC